MRKIKRFFLSRKTAFSLICAVGISCLIGSTIPQVAGKPPQFFETWKAESPQVYYLVDLLQLNQVYTSIWFLALVALVACSLAYSIYYQSKVLIRSGSPIQREITQGSFKNYHAVTVSGSEFRAGKLAHEIKAIFRARRYRPHLVTEGSKYLIFHKNKWGRWGGIVFHVGLLFMIAAALYSLAFQKRGFVQLISAETLQGNDEDWQSKRLGLFAGDFDLGFQVRLNEFAPTYWENDQVKDLVSSLTMIDEKGEASEFSVAPGKPVNFKGTKIYQSVNYGYALGFILKKEGEHEPVGTNFLLDAARKKDQPFKGKMAFPTTEYILDMKFHPNLIEPSFYATLPGVHLIVTEKGEQRFKGRVLFTQTALFGNVALKFAQVYYWTGLTFVKNYGMPLVYCGFALGTLGALLIFVVPYKEVHIKVTEKEDRIELSMGGRAKRYKALFSEEFKEIAQRLERGLGEHGNRSVAEI